MWTMQRATAEAVKEDGRRKERKKAAFIKTFL